MVKALLALHDSCEIFRCKRKEVCHMLKFVDEGKLKLFEGSIKLFDVIDLIYKRRRVDSLPIYIVQ